MNAEWWTVIVAAAAAMIAIWQAFEARNARTQALTAAKEAAEHEKAALRASQESATAAGRSAAAHERMVQLAEEDRAGNEWDFEPLQGELWAAVNRLGQDVFARLEGHDRLSERRVRQAPGFQDPGAWRKVRRGERIEFELLERATLSGTASVAVYWRISEGSPQLNGAYIINR